MMKKILALIFAALLTLTSCSNDVEKTTEPAQNEAESTTAEINFVSSDSAYKVIRPDSSAEDELKAAQEFVKSVNSACGKMPTFETDYTRPSDDPNADKNEILIGMTNRDATSKAYAMLSENEFVISVIDSRLVCVGYTPALTKIASEVLVDKISADGLVLSEDFCEHYKAEPRRRQILLLLFRR